MLDLNSHVVNLPFGWMLEMATNINNYGQIACSVNRPGEFNTLVVLTPVPDWVDRFSAVGIAGLGSAQKLGRRPQRDLFELPQVIGIVPAHGFDDGLEGHFAALGMGDWFCHQFGGGVLD